MMTDRTASSSNEQAYRRLWRAVRRVARVQRLVGALEGFMVGAATLLALLLVAILGVDWIADSSAARATFRAFVWFVPVAAAFGWCLARQTIFVRFSTCARAMERALGLCHNEVVNAVELGAEPSTVGTAVVSRSLVEKLVANVSSAVQRGDPLAAVDADRLRQTLLAVATGLAAFGIALCWAPARVHRALAQLVGPVPQTVRSLPRPWRSTATGPLVGDISLTYRYPAYTGRPTRTFRNTDGHIRAPKGTEVVVEARTHLAVRSAAIALSTGPSIAMRVDAEGRLSGTLVVTESGSYRFVLVPQRGPVRRSASVFTIDVEPDRPPEIRLDGVARRLSVTEGAQIDLPYEATDDYGVSEVRLVVRRSGKERATVVQRLRNPKRAVAGSYTWALAPLRLRPGERVEYRLEALDNDTVSGPNVGRTDTYVLEVRSAREDHRKVVALQAQVKRSMVHLLADDLERSPAVGAPWPLQRLRIDRTIQSRREALVQLMNRLLAQMDEDRLANRAYYEALTNMRDRIQARSTQASVWIGAAQRVRERPKALRDYFARLDLLHTEEVPDLEANILFLDHILQRQHLDEVRHEAEALLAAQRSVADMLEKLRNSKDAKTREQIESLLREIQERMAQLMAAMQKLASDLPSEFVNVDALRESAQLSMFDAYRRMLEAAQRGDMEQALREAQKLLAQLSRMLDQWQRSTRQFAQNRYGGMLKDLADLRAELETLERDERQIAADTHAVKRASQRRLRRTIDTRLQRVLAEQLERLKRVRKELDTIERQAQRQPAISQYGQLSGRLRAALRERSSRIEQLAQEKNPERRKKLRKDIRRTEDEIRDLAERMAQATAMRLLLDVLQELPVARDTAEQLRQSLEASDVSEAQSLAEQLARQLRSWAIRFELNAKAAQNKQSQVAPDSNIRQPVGSAAAESERIAAALERLANEIESARRNLLTPEERQKMDALAQRQQEVRKRTEGAQRRAAALLRKVPFMNGRIENELRNAGAFMQGAHDRLRQRSVGRALAAEREASARLAEAKKLLEEAQKMAQQGMMQGSMALPQFVMAPGAEGMRPDTRRVDIPSEDAYKVPKQFRQDILDAIRKGLPEPFREVNQEYYRSLLE